MSKDAGEIEEHLRAASDAILLLLTEIGQLEQHKRNIPPGEDRFDEVARSVRVVAQSLAEFTEHQEAWARIATADRDDLATIEQSGNAQSLAAILERWRAVERQLDGLEPGTPEAIRLFAEFESIRAEYMTAFRKISEGSAPAGTRAGRDGWRGRISNLRSPDPEFVSATLAVPLGT